MNALLEWWNFMFALPLVAALVIGVGLAFTGLGAEGGHTADHDSDDADDGDHGEAEARLDPLAWFGFGQGAPLTVLLPALLAAWGLGGIVLNQVLEPVLRFPAVFAPVSAVAGLLVAALVGRAVAAGFRRALETNKPRAIKRGGLVGQSGQAVFAINASEGVANVKDPFGNIHRISARTLEGPVISPDTEILLLDFDEAQGVYLVQPHPFPERRSSR